LHLYDVYANILAMSEQNKDSKPNYPVQRKLHNKLIPVIASLATLSAGGGVALAGDIVQHGENTALTQKNTTLTQTDNILRHNLGIAEADNLANANQLATEQATNLTTALANGETVTVAIFDGKLELNGKNGQPIPASPAEPKQEIVDPIILSTIDGQKANSFSDVAYFGVQTQIQEMFSPLSIVSEQYTANNYTVVPNNPNQPIKVVELYEQVDKYGYNIYAFDPTTKSPLSNPDGSIVEIGQPVNIDIKP
jgi:hypothetical protein